MSNITVAVGLIAFVVIIGLVVAAYPVVMGSLHEDAVNTGATMNASINGTLVQGEAVAQGFMGFSMAQVYVGIILLIIVVCLIIFSL
jgi:hypothetical protein